MALHKTAERMVDEMTTSEPEVASISLPSPDAVLSVLTAMYNLLSTRAMLLVALVTSFVLHIMAINEPTILKLVSSGIFTFIALVCTTFLSVVKRA